MSEELAAPPRPTAPPAAAPAGRRRWPRPAGRRSADAGAAGRRGVARCASRSVVLVALLVAPFIHVPYVIIGPGDATPLDQPVLQVHGAPTYDHNGDLLYLTVTVSNRDPNLYRWLFAKLDPDADVSKRQSIIGVRGLRGEQPARGRPDGPVARHREGRRARGGSGTRCESDAGPVQIVDVDLRRSVRGQARAG